MKSARWLHRLGVSDNKKQLVSEILRPNVAETRRVWDETRQHDIANMLERLVFIDETSLNTNLVKTTGWAPVRVLLIDHAPFGHLHSQTFIAGLARDGLIAPWILDGAMNNDSIESYVARIRSGAVARTDRRCRQPVVPQIQPRLRVVARPRQRPHLPAPLIPAI